MKYQHLKDKLGHILDEHLSQISQIHKVIIFNKDEECAYHNELLSKLVTELQNEENFLSFQSLERVNEIKSALEKVTDKLSTEVHNGSISTDLYNEFQNLSNEFVGRLLRFEYDYSQEGSGIDPLTGLRSQGAIFQDLTRELSACARRGDYLGIAMGRIDHFEDITKTLSKAEVDNLIGFVAQVLKTTMRLYDDGYRYKHNMFVVCFKHTDHLGAVSATERFVRLMREAHKTPEGRQLHHLLGQEITLSYSVAKLEVGSDIKDFLKQLERDVHENADEKASVLEYEDVSELEKFVKGIK